MIPLSDAEFDQALEDALATIPDEFRRHLDNVMIEICDAPDPAFMREHGVPDDLLGLYVGIPLEDKVLAEPAAPMPDRIFIFRDNLRDCCDTRDELIEEIRVTILHEIGHHFGMDEDQLADLGYD